jgi:uncharacterized protein (DUF427 family)
MMAKEIRVPDEDHPITIDADARRVVARVGNIVIAETNAALNLREAGHPPVHYFPLDDVVPGTIRPSSTQSYCPYKGDASYYDILLPGGRRIVDAVWTYPTPYPAMGAIANHVAFYTDRVQVTPEGAANHEALISQLTAISEPSPTAAMPTMAVPREPRSSASSATPTSPPARAEPLRPARQRIRKGY